MTFHNVRLPVDVEQGASGGPSFKTTVLELSSGYEKRNIDWQRVRGTWDVSYGLDTKANHEAFLQFFYARQGKAHSFRFKDWTDYHIGVDSTDSEQEVDITDGARDKFQVVRRYTSGAISFDREVTRIVSGTERVFLDSVEQMSGYTVDIETGVIDFTSPPSTSQSLGFIGEFDLPVRFDIDHLDINAMRDDAFAFPAVPIVEIRETLVDVS